MSKRLQITITDRGYEELMMIAEELRYNSKSGLIELSISELYKSLVKQGIINEQK